MAAKKFAPKVPKGYTFEDMQYAWLDGNLTVEEAVECGVLCPELAFESGSLTAAQAVQYGVEVAA